MSCPLCHGFGYVSNGPDGTKACAVCAKLPDVSVFGGEFKPRPAQERLHQADELSGYSLTFISNGPTRDEVDEVCLRVARESGLTPD